MKTNALSLLKEIEADFSLKPIEQRQVIKDFLREMERGLKGGKSSLKMLPAFVDTPTGDEKGKFIALDLGGTNFRILLIELKGKGRIIKLKERKFALKREHTKGRATELFDFLAESIREFCVENKIFNLNLGFTFSFPVRQTGIASGILLRWTKDFSLKDAVGKDVVELLNAALSRKGAGRIKVAALLNDTVGTLAACSYRKPSCDIAVILGTGTNACYREKLTKIIKWSGEKPASARMIINIEWGNFNKLKRTVYDRQLDRDSLNPGFQALEKMVSGMYLGEIARLVIINLIKKKIIFKGRSMPIFKSRHAFKSEHMSEIEADCSPDLLGIEKLLKDLGIFNSGLEERKLLKRICRMVARRSAFISASSLAAVIKKIDPELSRMHTVAIDGTVYEKYPRFSQNIRFALKEIFADKSRKINLVLTKDGSGIGAAITASL